MDPKMKRRTSDSSPAIYKYIAAAIVWLFSLYVTWTAANANLAMNVQTAVDRHDVQSNVRIIALEDRITRIEAKIDKLQETVSMVCKDRECKPYR